MAQPKYPHPLSRIPWISFRVGKFMERKSSACFSTIAGYCSPGKEREGEFGDFGHDAA
ncbi:hypothetical protein E4U38_002526 [Claviceps purpurea]|nr:hypothetical protein E4U38_002526 [Claviceps purpurea]